MSSVEQEYQLDFFKKNGFQRKTCPTCQKPFWTQDAKRTLCGDPPCVEYTFINAPPAKREYSLREMREKYLNFLEKLGHTRVKRYPVVARWRDDIYLTIASIADFQPHVTSGEVPPPANPLCISQPCIRLNDLDSVGKSGRHLTTFEMMAHHVFNYPGEQIYWKDRTTEICHEFLTKELGMPSQEITYKENPWSGGGNAGPAIEVLVRGLEVATLVFMKWAEDPNGPIDVKGEKYSEMDLQIVDTGYGLERLVWASNGRPTIYEAIFPDVVAWLKEQAGLSYVDKDPKLVAALAETSRLSSIMDVDSGQKVIELRKKVHERLQQKGVQITFEEMLKVWEPLEKVYALADHSRCLAFMLGDGIVPSNVKAGYLGRMVIRKSLRLIEDLKLKVTLGDIVDRQLDASSGDFPELKANRDYIDRVLELETQRYQETLDKGRRTVEREAKAFKGKALPLEKLMEWYDSMGLAPDIVKAAAEPLGVAVDIPDDFYNRVANMHAKGKAGEQAYDAAKTNRKFDNLPATKLLYYKDSTVKEFEAVVVYAKDGEVVLDQTSFYPEGGGQPADGGVIMTPDATFEVVDVQKYKGANGPVVVHKVEGGKLKAGAVVRARVDWGKRTAHTRHHTATHLILGSARRVLGAHTWQSGAQKGYERSRVDIAHYQRISDEELRQIEQLANTIVLEDLPVEKVWLPRDDAERKYGMQLYQGGIPEGKDVRVVRVLDFDVECCGGTHVKTTSDIGPIKIIRAERVQDGVERIEFSAGLAAVRYVQRREEILKEAAEVLSVPTDEVPKAAKKFFDEWKSLRKELDEKREALARLESETVKLQLKTGTYTPDFEHTTAEGQRILLEAKLTADPNSARDLAQEFSRALDATVVVVNGQGQFVVSKPANAPGDAAKIAKLLADGKAGGKPELAQGVMPGVTVTSEADLVRLVAAKLKTA